MPLNWSLALAQAHWIGGKLRRAGLGGPRQNLPILYIGGILGTKLYDRRLQMSVWGDWRGILFHRPEHAGYAFEDNNRLIAVEHLHAFNIVPGLVDSLVTAELKLTLEHALGYREGVDLFFLGYDWRADNRLLSARLEVELERLRLIFGPRQKIILIGQSSANLAIRHWLRSASEQNRNRIAKWYVFGPPWQGAFHALSMMMTGYWPAGGMFHGFTGDDIAAAPGIHQVLPVAGEFVDRRGNTLSLDLYDEACWRAHRLGPYCPDGDNIGPVRRRAREHLAENLTQAKAFHNELRKLPPHDRDIPQLWFLSDQNRAVRRAVLDGDRNYLTGAAIARHIPELADHLLEPGDDHLPLSQLLAERPGPIVRCAECQPWGESFVYISKAKTHRDLINHLPNKQSLAFDLAVERTRS
jgi:hypothetical protein